MGRQHRLDAHGVEQTGKRRGRDAIVPQLVEGVPQRHGRAGAVVLVGAQPAHSLPLLAEVDQVEKQAESVRDVRGLAERKPFDLVLVRLDQGRGGILPDLLREMAQVLDGRECLRPALLLRNRAQARGQEPDFASERVIHFGYCRRRNPNRVAQDSFFKSCGLPFGAEGPQLQRAEVALPSYQAGSATRCVALLPSYAGTPSTDSSARRKASSVGSTRSRWLDSCTSERCRITYSVSFS